MQSLHALPHNLSSAEGSNIDPEKTPKTPPAKRSLLDACSSGSSGEKKRKMRIGLNSTGDNVKRDCCAICLVTRQDSQRGSLCDVCMRLFRKETGHQGFTKCKDDKDLLSKIAQQSKSLQQKSCPEKRVPWRTRVMRIEAKVSKLCVHFGLE